MTQIPSVPTGVAQIEAKHQEQKLCCLIRLFEHTKIGIFNRRDQIPYRHQTPP